MSVIIIPEELDITACTQARLVCHVDALARCVESLNAEIGLVSGWDERLERLMTERYKKTKSELVGELLIELNLQKSRLMKSRVELAKRVQLRQGGGR
ncbi:TPA: hypothetical protein LU109_003615 [Enterobacter hormaechei subsp. xiangfangensis]|nr:hypothetical protein [Enterobacter hormaechei subsp. xiangfangensis]